MELTADISKRMALIGRGEKGSVSRNRNSDRVIKTTDAETIQREKRAAAILSLPLVDPDQRYTIYGTEFTDTTMTMPFGGDTIVNVIDAEWYMRFIKDPAAVKKAITRIKDVDLAGLEESLSALIAWMPTLHESGIAHSDNIPANIVWDGSRVRLIDWEKAEFRGEAGFDRTTRDDMLELTTMLGQVQTLRSQSLAAYTQEGSGRRKRVTRRRAKKNHTRN